MKSGRLVVPHSEEPGKEVDLAGHCGDGQQAGGPHDEEGEYCFVGEVRVNVRSFLENDDVAACSLGR